MVAIPKAWGWKRFGEGGVARSAPTILRQVAPRLTRAQQVTGDRLHDILDAMRSRIAELGGKQPDLQVDRFSPRADAPMLGRAKWDDSPWFADLVLGNADRGNHELYLHDVSLPGDLRGKGVYSAGLAEAAAQRDAGFIDEGVGVHFPLQPDKWRELLRRHGFTPTFGVAGVALDQEEQHKAEGGLIVRRAGEPIRGALAHLRDSLFGQHFQPGGATPADFDALNESLQQSRSMVRQYSSSPKNSQVPHPHDRDAVGILDGTIGDVTHIDDVPVWGQFYMADRPGATNPLAASIAKQLPSVKELQQFRSPPRFLAGAATQAPSWADDHAMELLHLGSLVPGLGSRLLREARELPHLKDKTIVLDALQTPHTMKFYEEMGFEPGRNLTMKDDWPYDYVLPAGKPFARAEGGPIKSGVLSLLRHLLPEREHPHPAVRHGFKPEEWERASHDMEYPEGDDMMPVPGITSGGLARDKPGFVPGLARQLWMESRELPTTSMPLPQDVWMHERAPANINKFGLAKRATGGPVKKVRGWKR